MKNTSMRVKAILGRVENDEQVAEEQTEEQTDDLNALI